MDFMIWMSKVKFILSSKAGALVAILDVGGRGP